jgi:hypothetical protein
MTWNPPEVCFRSHGRVVLLMSLLLSGSSLAGEQQPSPLPPPAIRAVRLTEHPIITQDMPNMEGVNTDGPSLVMAPPWVEHPLGKYYLYFADHHGQHISLATADHLEGPWTVRPGGVLARSQTVCRNHIASPDVHVVPATKEVRMYFHGPDETGVVQLTYLARSRDGVNFTAEKTPLGPSYFSVFEYGGWHYTVTKKGEGGGYLFRSRDGVTPFEQGPLLIGEHMRHAGCKVTGNNLDLFYSVTGEAPEQIYCRRIDLSRDWKEWASTMSPPVPVLKPERDYEGADLPAVPSEVGGAKGRRNELRDPALFTEGNRTFLVYSVAGESALGIAELFLVD